LTTRVVEVTLTPLPDAVAPEVRLRTFLKRALRGYKLRCLNVTVVGAAPPQNNKTSPAETDTLALGGGVRLKGL
jgi:hypothetical protein